MQLYIVMDCVKCVIFNDLCINVKRKLQFAESCGLQPSFSIHEGCSSQPSFGSLGSLSRAGGNIHYMTDN